MDGCLDAWDILYQQRAPLLSIKVNLINFLKWAFYKWHLARAFKHVISRLRNLDNSIKIKTRLDTRSDDFPCTKSLDIGDIVRMCSSDCIEKVIG